jgi:hypothetical protein
MLANVIGVESICWLQVFYNIVIGFSDLGSI